MNACSRLDSVGGVLNVESYNYGTLPSQVPIWQMEHGSTAEMHLLLFTESLELWRSSFIGVVEVNTKINLEK